MRILAVETSAVAASVAVVADGKLLCRSDQNAGLTHSQTLLPMLRCMLENSGLKLSDMDRLAVAVGPGSFTGLRIGVAAVQGLASGSGVGCVGVSTLEAAAHPVSHMGGLICAAMDARRGEVYGALFRGGERLLRLAPDAPIPVEALFEKISTFGERVLFVGDGAELCHAKLKNRLDCALAPPHLRYQSAVGVAAAAEGAPPVAPGELFPVYLRLSQAERERAARQKAETTQITDGGND